MFITRDSLPESLVLAPRGKHGLQTKSIWVFHILIQSGAECPVAQKDQSDLFHEPEKLDVVFRGDFDFERNGNRPVVALRQVKRTLLLLERMSLLVYFRRKIDRQPLAVSALAIPSALAKNNAHLKSASTPQTSPANDMPACDTIIWVAFIPNTTLTPANGIRKPPRAGPMIPARFIWIPPMAIAEGSSYFPTISGIEAEATGAWTAKPVPSRKTPARMIAGVNPPRKAQAASKPALIASQALEMRSS